MHPIDKIWLFMRRGGDPEVHHHDILTHALLRYSREAFTPKKPVGWRSILVSTVCFLATLLLLAWIVLR
jgi:hypothetical protein